MNKYFILITLVFCIGLFGQSETFAQDSLKIKKLEEHKRLMEYREKVKGDKKKYPSVLVSELYPPESKKTSIEIQELYKDYLNKCKELGIDVIESLEDYIFYMRININAMNEFYKAGIDLSRIFSRVFYDGNTKDNAERITLTSQIIIFGVLSDISKYDNSNLWQKATIKIDEVLKGEFYFDELPNEFYWYIGGLYLQHGRGMGYVEFEKGDKILLFVNKNGMDNELALKKIISSEKSPKLRYGYDVFKKNETHDLGVEEYFIVKEDQFVSKDYVSYGEHNYVYEGKVDSVLQVIRKVERINDTPNFYNRSYK